ncbi:MAG TPA: ATP-binding protein, partial [Polyangiaceae bacterium]|nr:ATP-binding protein [Polyangiaceae bacterium]
EACEQVALELARVPSDVPFALLYLLDGAGVAHLSGAANIAHGSALAPLQLPPRSGGPWPWEGLEGGPRVVPLVAGPGGARAAAILPLEASQEGERGGFIVAGLSAMLADSASYQRFHELLVASLSQAVRNAAAQEREQPRAREPFDLDRQKAEFSRRISHELRTPLTLMLAPLEEASGREVAELGGEALQLVRRNARRLLELVDSLLDFSRIETGHAEPRFQGTNLAQLTADIASPFRPLLEQSGLSLRLDCPPLPEPAHVDPELWEKIVVNLLSNAFKFTFEGSIEVSLKAVRNSVVLCVADTGTGIPRAELPGLFEGLRRVESARSRSQAGSGMGLALVQQLVQLHGGSVHVESQVGVGSRFSVSIPLGQAHLPAERMPAPPRAPSRGNTLPPYVEEPSDQVSQARTRTSAAEDAASVPSARARGAAVARPRLPGRILLAEGNADLRDYVSELLLAEGWSVHPVEDGQTALQRLREDPPDLLLADVVLPQLDGLALLRASRENVASRAVPVILLSAWADDEASAEGLELGAEDYLVKPFSAKELVARIAACLEVARARSEASSAADSVRERWQAQLMQAPMAVAVVSAPDFRYVLANPLYQELVGRRELLGKNSREAFPEFPENAPVHQLMSTVYESGEPFKASNYFVPIDRRGDGQVEDAYFKFTCQPLRDTAGKITEIMIVAIDVTADALARQRIEALVQELERADQRKDEFLATLAHELRNPMAAISSALSLLDDTGSDTAKAARYRAAVRRQLGNLVRLVDDLLDVARISRGKVELRKDDVDMAVVLRHALTAVSATLESRRHTLDVSIDAGPFGTYADATRLEQIIVNLLTNAAKYTEPGGKISVRLSNETLDGAEQVVLRVRDSGRGIPKEMLTKVFDLFTQVSPGLDRSTGGLGLGLTVCKYLTEMHGGSVSAASEGPGRGSEFCIRLPLSPSDGVEPETAAPPPSAKRVARRQRILVVEDSDDARELLQECLQSLGHEVVVAQDGMQGFERLVQWRPNVALIDLGLPGIDGYELARLMRAEPEGQDVYLVALTGYGGSNVKQLAHAAGFDLHLTKPADLAALSELIQARGASRPHS